MMTSNPLLAAVGAGLAPLLGVQGVPYFVHGQYRQGWTRLVAGLALVAAVVWFYGGQAGFGLVLFEPGLFIVLAVLVVGGYLWLWIEGLVFTWRHLPSAG